MRTYMYIKLTTMVLLFTLFALPAKADFDFNTPEDYAKEIKTYFDNNQWEEGKQLLDKAFKHYSGSSDLQWLMGKYWYNYKDYDQARYHLVKAVKINYNNIYAKQLLVNVEEDTKNYSSAICYVNELLEVNPYWRGLWRRKIELYRKQGNDIEADRLLKRIDQIYPNDSLMNSYYVNSMEENYYKYKKEGNRKNAIAALEEYVKKSTPNEVHYLDLINLYLQDGNKDKALTVASNGAADIPGSIELVNKKVGILTEFGRYQEALAFIKDQQKRGGNSAQLSRLYSVVLTESASAQRQQDPYVLYGMLYDKGQKNKDIIQYLISTAINRGYYDDAQDYIRDARRMLGDNDRWVLYNEYLLSRKMNLDNQAFGILTKLSDVYPEDLDVQSSLCEMKLERATALINLGNYSDALIYAQWVADKNIDNEYTKAALEKEFTCFVELKKYTNALSTLDLLSKGFPETTNIIGKRADLLNKMGKTTEALELYRTEISKVQDDERLFYIIGYEEIAIPFIKSCVESGATGIAYKNAVDLLQINPNSYSGLQYAINTAGVLDNYDAFRKYTEEGARLYPGDPFFKVKQATIYNRNKNYQASLNLLYPVVANYPGRRELIDAYSESAESRAIELIKKRETTTALALIDTALRINPTSRSLKYTKGVVYDVAKQPDSALFYQKFYQPTPDEEFLFRHHLAGLKNETYKNRVGIQYLQSRHGDVDQINSIASLEYTHMKRKNDYTLRLNYAGRDGVPSDSSKYSEEGVPGGRGIQLQGEWEHRFGNKWAFMINAALASQYFPQFTGNLALSKGLRRNWDINFHIGYRLPESYQKNYAYVTTGDATTGITGAWTVESWNKKHVGLTSVGVGLSKSYDQLWFNGKLDLFSMQSHFYYNTTFEGRYFPLNDKRSYISALAGFGTAPESGVLDFALTNSISHMNTMVGLGGIYLLNSNISVGLMGTWLTYYNETTKRLGTDTNYLDIIQTKYRNLFNVYVQLYIAF